MDAVGKHGRGAESIVDSRKVAGFWVGSGAKVMVKNALCSPELKDWLLRFTATCTNIGYTKEVTAVYKVKLQGQKAENFPFSEDENIHGQTLWIDNCFAANWNCRI